MKILQPHMSVEFRCVLSLEFDNRCDGDEN